MNYEMFVNVIAENMKPYLPEMWENAEISVVTIGKINCERTGLVFARPDRRYSPTIYLEEFYQMFQEGCSLEEIMEKIQNTLIGLEKEKIQSMELSDLLEQKENVFLEVINTKENEELLRNLPHREFMDLSIVYRWLIKKDEAGLATVPITHDLAEFKNLTEEQLYELAYENTRRIFPIMTAPMDKVVEDIFGLENEEEHFIADESKLMHVITNDSKNYGANALLYPDEIQKLAVALGDDLYLVPSSRHEIIAIPKDVGNAQWLADLVYEVNMNHVLLEDRLSNQIYQYDRGAREVTKAIELPYRPLTESKAEPKREERERSTVR